MSVLTYLHEAAIRDKITQIEGEMITRPALIKSDGTNLTYAADVRIPGYNDPLRSVSIAAGNRELIYADAGAAVTLARNAAGRLEVVGFAKRKPGTRTRVAVDLATLVAGPQQDVGLRVYILTLGDLGDPKYGNGFGTVPLGAYAVFQGSTLLEVKS